MVAESSIERAARLGGGAGIPASPPTEGWHLDRRVPIAIIITLAMQTAGAIWYAAEMSTQVRQHTIELQRLERDFVGRRSEDRAEVKEFIQEVRSSLRRIEDKLADKMDRAR